MLFWLFTTRRFDSMMVIDVSLVIVLNSMFSLQKKNDRNSSKYFKSICRSYMHEIQFSRLHLLISVDESRKIKSGQLARWMKGEYIPFVGIYRGTIECR